MQGINFFFFNEKFIMKMQSIFLNSFIKKNSGILNQQANLFKMLQASQNFRKFSNYQKKENFWGRNSVPSSKLKL